MARPAVVQRLVATSVLAMVLACGGDDGGAGPKAGCRDVEQGRVTVVADDLAWDTSCLRGPADEPFTIVVDNRDEDVNHNLTLSDAPGQPSTELEQGPVVQELEVTLPDGSYEYVCDIHPNMVGTLTLAATPPPEAG